jgi:heat shock protein HslJ
MSKALFLVASIASGLVFASCAGTPMAEQGASAPPSGSWMLVELDGRALEPGGEGAMPTMVFAPDVRSVSGSGSCNRYGATYLLDGAGGFVFEGFWATKMFCLDAPIESEFFIMLGQVRSFQVAGVSLAFIGADGVVLARFGRTD